MFSETIRIPKERVAVLIGEKGVIKKQLQNQLNVMIYVDSKDGLVEIISEDGYNNYLAKNVVQLIGRGLTPGEARQILNENCSAEIINIKEFTGGSKKKQERIKGRLIGKEGSVRKTLERLTNTKIVIYGKTVTILGITEDVEVAKRAVEKLLTGTPHGHVYAMIERFKDKDKD
jgi:ribosomal RNA assembly protein